MKPILAIGIMFLVGGILMLVYRDSGYTRYEKIAQFGPIHIIAKERETISWPSLLGVAVVGVGSVLIVEGVRQGEGGV